MSRYENAKNAPVGAMIACPTCNKQIRKMSYGHKFCSRIGPGNCKDTYWNIATPERRDRAIDHVGGPEEHPFSSEGLGQW